MLYETKQEPLVIYDKIYEPIVLSKATIDQILKCDKPADCIALYTFYYYTAKWQKTQKVKATISYVEKGLGMCKSRVKAAKKELLNIGLIEDVKTIDDKTKKILGWYIFVHFASTKSQGLFLAGGGLSNDKCFSYNNSKCLTNNIDEFSKESNGNNSDSESTDKKQKAEGPKKNQPRSARFVKPTVEEIAEYVAKYSKQKNKTPIDPERFFDHYEARGWMLGKNKMKDWEAAVRTWFKNQAESNQSISINEHDMRGYK